VRWLICALHFFVVVLNHIDRQVLSVLKPMLQQVGHRLFAALLSPHRFHAVTVHVHKKEKRHGSPCRENAHRF
jgi:hypothetical protein